jgi:hypothetical protein
LARKAGEIIAGTGVSATLKGGWRKPATARPDQPAPPPDKIARLKKANAELRGGCLAQGLDLRIPLDRSATSANWLWIACETEEPPSPAPISPRTKARIANMVRGYRSHNQNRPRKNPNSPATIRIGHFAKYMTIAVTIRKAK